ncbi:MAG: hypothetical protein KQH83_04740 [Actinobacteria bacterium]|nr:hypothetical protein [Actinomycetota bacterium]
MAGMQCELCGESAVSQRGDAYLCGRCALRADWVDVARSVQGVPVRRAAAAPPPPPPQAAAPAPPADPFS